MGFTGSYLSSGIQLQPSSFETGVKDPIGGDSINLFAIWVWTKLHFNGEAVANPSLYLVTSSQLNSVTRFLNCSVVHDRGVSFWPFTGLVMAIVMWIGEAVGSLSLRYLLRSSLLMSITDFETSWKEREGGVSFWLLIIIIEAFESFTLCSPSLGCQTKSITGSLIIWEGEGVVSPGLLTMWAIVNLNCIGQTAVTIPSSYLWSRSQPKSITWFVNGLTEFDRVIS